jgi:hypothetical protein
MLNQGRLVEANLSLRDLENSMNTTLPGGSASALTADEAQAIGVDAYIYFYSLTTMDLTRKQSINIQMLEFGKGPMNTFVNVPAYTPGDFKAVVRANFQSESPGKDKEANWLPAPKA